MIVVMVEVETTKVMMKSIGVSPYFSSHTASSGCPFAVLTHSATPLSLQRYVGKGAVRNYASIAFAEHSNFHHPQRLVFEINDTKSTTAKTTRFPPASGFMTVGHVVSYLC